MDEHNHMIVVSCPNCGQKSEFEIIHCVDSHDNAYEKQFLLNETLFEHKCEKCGDVSLFAYEVAYVDRENNAEIYLVHESHLEGANTMLHMAEVVERRYKIPDCTNQPILRKRIVTCPCQMKEKILILEAGYDDRIIEMIKLICMNGAEIREVEGFYPIYAKFATNNGKYGIEVHGENDDGEDEILFSEIPMELYNELADEYEELLMDDSSFVVDETWAMAAMGVDPYEDDECDGDCAHCIHNCDDLEDDELDFDENCDYFDEDYKCDDCECTGVCKDCPCDCCGDDGCEECEYGCHLNKED